MSSRTWILLLLEGGTKNLVVILGRQVLVEEGDVGERQVPTRDRIDDHRILPRRSRDGEPPFGLTFAHAQTLDAVDEHRAARGGEV